MSDNWKERVHTKFLVNNTNDDASTMFRNVLQQTNSLSGYADIAVVNMSNVLDRIPFFPQICCLTEDEFGEYFERVDGAFTPDILAVSGRIPVCSLIVNETLTVCVTTINDFKILLKIKTSQRGSSFILNVYSDYDELFQIKVDASDIIEFDISNVFSRMTTVTPVVVNEAGVDQDLVLLDDVTYTTDVTFVLCVRHALISTDDYEDIIIKEYEKVISRSKLMGVNLPNIRNYAISDVASGLSLAVNIVMCSTVILNSVVDDDQLASLYSVFRTKKKILLEFDCTRIQASAFKRQAITLMDKFTLEMGDSVDALLVKAVNRAAKLSEEISNVSDWRHASVDSARIGSCILPPLQVPYYCAAVKGDLAELKSYSNGVSAVNSFTSFHYMRNLCIDGVTNLVIEGIKSNSGYLEDEKYTEYILLEDSAQRVIYGLISVDMTLTSEIPVDHDEAGCFTRHDSYQSAGIFSANIDDTTRGAFRGTDINITINTREGEIVVLQSCKFTRRIRIHKVIICDKFALNYCMESVGTISGFFILFDKKIEFKCETMTNVDIITKEYGRLYGLAFEFNNDKLEFEYNNNLHSYAVPNKIEVSWNTSDLNADWGLIWYFPEVGSNKLYGGKGLLKQSEIGIRRDVSNNNEFFIATELNNEYVYANGFFVCITSLFKDHHENQDVYKKQFDAYRLNDSVANLKNLNDVYFNRLYFSYNMHIGYVREVSRNINNNRIYLNQFSTDSDKLYSALKHDVNFVKYQISDINKRIDSIETKIRGIMDTLNPTILEMIRDVAIGYIGGKAASYAISKVLGVLGEVLKRNMRKIEMLTHVLLSINDKVIRDLKHFKNGVIPFEIMGKNRLRFEIVSKMANKSNEFRALMRYSHLITSKGFDYNKLCVLQNVDDMAKLMLLSNYKKGVGGIIQKGADSVRLRLNRPISPCDPELNVTKDNVFLPSISVFYRPLDVGIRSVNKVIFNSMVSIQKVKHDLLYNAMDMSVRRPGHSYAVVTETQFSGDGSIIQTRIFTGIGELNVRGAIGSDINSGIGGVCVKYTTDNMSFDHNGKMLFKVMPYTASSYTIDDVKNLYSTLFKVKFRHNQSIDPDLLWQRIANHVDKKIVSGVNVYQSYIPDQSKMKVIREIIDDPPRFGYHLLNNNCQTYTKDLVNFVRSDVIPKTWNVNAMHEANSSMIMYKIDEINKSIDHFKSDVQELISSFDGFVSESLVIFSDAVDSRTGLKTAFATTFEVIEFVDSNCFFESPFINEA